MTLRTGACLLCIILLICVAFVAVAPAATTTETQTMSAAEKAVIAANNQFGLELYQKFAKDQKNRNANLFYSPFSLSSALAITTEGAKGTTATQLMSVFHFPKDNLTRQKGYSEYISDLNANDTAFEMKTANALWVEKTYALLPSFTDTALHSYGARATNLDFVTKTEESRQVINGWVEDQTNGKIEDLIPQGSFTSDSRLVITNAVYFHGKWVLPFDKADTTDQPFKTLSGKTVTARMMEQTGMGVRFPYAETSKLQAISLPYNQTGEKQLSMLIILPKGNSYRQVESSFDAKTLASVRKSLKTQRVDTYIPKFKLETEYGMVPVLKSMGVKAAFTPGTADFSGMDGTRNLYVSDVIHKAYVDVDEEGTEAAAATGVIVGLAAAQPQPAVPVFRADHPFIFLIQDDQTGAVLFMGRVANPVA